jgi:hypothetical protein
MLRRDGTGLGHVQRVRAIETVTEAIQLPHEPLQIAPKPFKLPREAVTVRPEAPQLAAEAVKVPHEGELMSLEGSKVFHESSWACPNAVRSGLPDRKPHPKPQEEALPPTRLSPAKAG